MAAPICPHCNSASTKRKGHRKTKNGPRQMYVCVRCGKRFTPSPLPLYSYPPAAVLSAPVLHCLGYTLRHIQSRIKGRFGCRPSLTVISKWIKAFGKLSAMAKHRDEIQAFSSPSRLIVRRLFKHRQNYLFQIHRYKLSNVPAQYSAISNYLLSIHSGEIGIDPGAFSNRSSSLPVGIPHPHLSSADTYPSRLAETALKSARNNYERHSALQRFFIAADLSTVAVEVPVFLTPQETKTILKTDGGLLGHIDFLQVLKHRVTVLDYKPDAHKEKRAHEQLILYAIALSKRTGIHLREMTCAWFDENHYYSFPAAYGYSLLRQALAD